MSDMNTSRICRHRQPDRYGFNTYELLISATIILLLLWWLFTHVNGHSHSVPPENRVRLAFSTIQKAMAECILESGSAPTAVDDLPQLLDRYLESGGLARDMVTTGNDYWGNRLQIEPVMDEPGRYALRSHGPIGVLDQ